MINDQRLNGEEWRVSHSACSQRVSICYFPLRQRPQGETKQTIYFLS